MTNTIRLLALTSVCGSLVDSNPAGSLISRREPSNEMKRSIFAEDAQLRLAPAHATFRGFLYQTAKAGRKQQTTEGEKLLLPVVFVAANMLY